MVQTSLEFTSLPLVETHIRLVSETPFNFGFQAVREFAGKIEGRGFIDFRDEETFKVHPTQTGVISFGPVGSPMGISFRSPKGLTIRVQPQMIEAEWIRSEHEEYPRFQPMLEALEQTVECLDSLRTDSADFTIANMSYANLLDFGAWPTVERLADYFVIQFGMPGTGENLHRFESAWSGEIDHRFTVECASETPNDPPTKAMVTNTAGVRMAAGSDFRVQVISVHDFLITWFIKLLTDKAKHEFGYHT